MINKRLSSRQVYAGRIINLRLDEVELPDGRAAEREIVEHPGAAAIVPLDSEGKVHLVRQYRDAIGQELLEIPAGKLKHAEEPAFCAGRELEEELGLIAGKITRLATFYSTPGFCDEVMHLFLAEDLAASQQGGREEFISAVTVPLEPLSRLLAALKDAKSIAGVLLAAEVVRNRGKSSR
jgi:ADP-ribose pyrophosphatase